MQQQVGAAAERAVVEYLRARGLAIVATNLRIGRLELDVVARDGGLIIVIEVRSRGPGAWQGGLGSIDGRKRLRIRRAAERLWRDRYKHDPSAERLRFDVASVVFEDGVPAIEYVVAAF